MLSVPASVAGQYTVRLRNVGLTSVTATVTLIQTVMR